MEYARETETKNRDNICIIIQQVLQFHLIYLEDHKTSYGKELQRQKLIVRQGGQP